MRPFIPSLINDCHSTYCDLSHVITQTRLRPNRTKKAVPAIRNCGGMQQSQIEWLQRAWSASSPDPGDNGGLLGGLESIWICRVDVWKTHGCGVEYSFLF